MSGRQFNKLHLVLLGLVLALPAFAMNENAVSGVVTNVDVRNEVGTLTLKVDATGAERTFWVTEETSLETELAPESVLSTVALPSESVKELREGDEVELHLRKNRKAGG